MMAGWWVALALYALGSVVPFFDCVNSDRAEGFDPFRSDRLWPTIVIAICWPVFSAVALVIVSMERRR